MKVITILLLFIIVGCGSLLAQQFSPIGPGSSVPIGPGVVTGGSTPPVTGCDGTINLSTGCVQPMLGGI